VEDLADRGAALDELSASGLDVVRDEQQSPLRSRGVIVVTPVPKLIEAPDPGGVSCTMRKSSLATMSASSRHSKPLQDSSERSTSETGRRTTSRFRFMASIPLAEDGPWLVLA
jgi:hypothetical protein